MTGKSINNPIKVSWFRLWAAVTAGVFGSSGCRRGCLIKSNVWLQLVSVILLWKVEIHSNTNLKSGRKKRENAFCAMHYNITQKPACSMGNVTCILHWTFCFWFACIFSSDYLICLNWVIQVLNHCADYVFSGHRSFFVCLSQCICKCIRVNVIFAWF